MEPNPLPSLCRAVIYVQTNGCKRAAIVADVSLDRPSVVLLAVFVPCPTPGPIAYVLDVKYAPADTCTPNSWHYPPRVG